jgi:acyl-CoA synthetase (AMP-forming)/AMP-acid ligase II
VSYTELRRRSERTGERLASVVQPGTRIGLLSLDRHESFELLFGSAYAGAVLTPINTKLALQEIEYIVNDAAVAILFVERAFYGAIQQLEPSFRHRPVIVALDGDHGRWPSYEAWRQGPVHAKGPYPATPDDVVGQYYTSGTTGRPKGVQLAHRSFFAVHERMREAGEDWFLWRSGDIGLLCLPFFHVCSPWLVAGCFTARGTLVVLPAFDPKAVLRAIEDHRVTRTVLVPAMLQLVLAEAHARQIDFSSLRQCFYGGSPMSISLLQRAQRKIACEFIQIYGLTETGNAAVSLSPEDHRSGPKERLRAAGRALAGVEVKCIDRDGQRLPAGQTGEICIRSPANMVGYWGLPGATSDTLQDGFVHTGDAGHIDADGYVYISDRLKDMVISAGENIYPAEVEDALLSHPDVAEAAVIGVPHERWGEAVKALLVARAGRTPGAAEILEHARGQIAEYKLPRSIEFVANLPRNPMGKLKRGELRAPYWAGRERRVN